MRISSINFASKQTVKRTMDRRLPLLGARLASALITLVAALTLMTATASAQVTVAGSTGADGPYTTLKACFRCN